MQKTGAGLQSASSCYWDNQTDGSCTVRWENKTRDPQSHLKLPIKAIMLYNVNFTGSTLLDPSKDNVLYRLGVWPGHLKISVKKSSYFLIKYIFESDVYQTGHVIFVFQIVATVKNGVKRKCRGETEGIKCPMSTSNMGPK